MGRRKHLPILILAGTLAGSAVLVTAQTKVDLRKQSKHVDFTGADSTKPMKSGTSLPATCATGEMFFNSAAAAGMNVYGCTAGDTWTLQSGGGGGGSVTIENDGTVVGARPVENFVHGLGLVTAISDTGTQLNIQQMVDTAVIQSRAGAQSGGTLLCASGGGSSTAYTCAMSPTLGAYTTGMVIQWRPDVNGSGGATTLNIDTLGAMGVKLADGLTDPTAADLVGGRLYAAWFDGTRFRLQQPATTPLCASSGGSPTAYTCAMSPTLGAYTTGLMIQWRPDVNGSGGATTLNVDTLGAKEVKLSDGLANPTAADVVGGRLYAVWFDGTRFRLQQPATTPLCASSGGSPTAYTCAMSPTLGAYTTGMVVQWRPDVNGSGGATTLNVDTLGAKEVKLADGLTNPTAADVAGGRLYAVWFDGTRFRLQQPATTPLCASSGGSPTVYTCAMSPTLSAYATGMVIQWMPDVNGSGGATTLNVDTLGAKGVKLADGLTDPTAADLVGGRLYAVWFDGTRFRLPWPGLMAGVTGTRPACDATQRGRIWQVLGGTGVKDELAVCAKDAANAYAWRVLY